MEVLPETSLNNSSTLFGVLKIFYIKTQGDISNTTIFKISRQV